MVGYTQNKHFTSSYASAGTPNRSFPAMTMDGFLPEKGMMLNADFPQPLGSSVVRKLKTNCAFKLLVLEGRGN